MSDAAPDDRPHRPCDDVPASILIETGPAVGEHIENDLKACGGILEAAG